MRNPFDDLVDDVATPRSFVRQAWAGFALVVFLFLAIALALHFIARAQAQGVGFTREECLAYGRFARVTAEIRDIGANATKHLQLVRERIRENNMAVSSFIERELGRVYAEGLPPADAEVSAYTRCMTGEIVRSEG